MIETDQDIWQWHGAGHWIGVTSNHSIRGDGSNVMGKGIAKEAAVRFPSLPLDVGQMIRCYPESSLFVFENIWLFTFNVKKTWQKPAEVALIEKSCQALIRFMKTRPEAERFYLAAPGAGAGLLDYESQVRPLLLTYFENESRLIIGRKKEIVNKEID